MTISPACASVYKLCPVILLTIMKNNLLVSVIIPAYNGADSIAAAIQSVLAQTHANFELIVVDDKSPDTTGEVVQQFSDARMKYIRHEQNRGASTARWTGITHSAGEIVAFLDQDDTFQPEKLEAHVKFLEENPEVGFSYNLYYERVHSSNSIRTVAVPPQNITLGELALGFYLPPSSWVVRRQWALIEEIWHPQVAMRGREIIVCGKLFMAGCKFSRIDRVLHSRNYQAGRRFGALEKKCEDELACQEAIFSDPRCPQEVSNMRPLGNSAIRAMWANVAFTQGETAVGRKFLWDISQNVPGLFYGAPSLYATFLMGYCVDDESHDYETLLESIFKQLPVELPGALENYLWAVARGNYVRGIRALLWGRADDAEKYFALADETGFQPDQAFALQATHEMMGYAFSEGVDAVTSRLDALSSQIEPHLGRRGTQWLVASFLVNVAEQKYRNGETKKIPSLLLNAFRKRPNYLADRGTLSIFVKSMFGISARS